MKKVSIIIPVIRKKSAIKCFETVIKNAGIPEENFEILMELDEDGIGCPAMVKKLVKKAKHNLIMFLGDDTEPEKDFLKYALEAMETLQGGWGVVGLNTQDVNTGGNPIAHWLAHTEMLNYIQGNQFFSTDYKHCWCDNELKDVADELGRWVFAEKAKIKHNHPVNKTAEYDEGYQKAYTDENTIHDYKTYCIRKRQRMVDNYGTKLGIAVPLTDAYVYNQFFFSFIKVITEYTTELASEGKSISMDVLMPDFPGQIDAIRNNLVHQALKLGCTHVLMMDTDQIYNESNLIKKMLAHQAPVLGARVHRRYPPFDHLLFRGEVGKLYSVPDDEIKDKDGNFAKEVKVDYTGTGCIMYDTRVFIDMLPDNWFEFKTDKIGRPVGEDINFCTKLKENDIPVVVDASIDIKHLTLMAVDWSTHKLFKKIEMSSKPPGATVKQ